MRDDWFQRGGLPVTVEFADYVEDDIFADQYRPYDDEPARTSVDAIPAASGLDPWRFIFQACVDAGHSPYRGAGREHRTEPSPFDVLTGLDALTRASG